ncbi:hypothetical protein [Streptomyces sp. HNM0574]|uniref:hypothetical protein n=1 Tax=Streptomyces sp. HNM0574 TaxID=2714954 RepID=UPI0032172641
MNTAPYLLPEDRPEFERVLDEALRTTGRRPAPHAAQQLGPEQLRSMALSAVTAIAACAAAEYHRYVTLRAEERGAEGSAVESASGSDSASASGDGSGSDSGSSSGTSEADERSGAVDGVRAAEGGGELAGSLGEGLTEAAGTAGAGLLAMASVLLPALAGTAAVIFLLLGYLLQVVTPEPALAAPMRTAGWVFAALAVTGVLVGLVGLWITALRNGSRSRRAARAARAARGPDGRAGARGAYGPVTELSAAREAWREALLERGILPFLSEALADPKGAKESPSRYVPAPRFAELGYSGPEFSSRTSTDEPSPAEPATPRYSSPDYSSPQYDTGE